MYRKIDVGTWVDGRFRALAPCPPNPRYLWFFLMTGKYTINIPGIVVAKPGEMAAHLDWPLEGFAEAFAEILDQGLAEADTEAGLVWLPNGPKHNPPASPNVITSWSKTWTLVPDCPLKTAILGELKAFAKASGKAWYESLIRALPNQDQDQDQDQKQKQRGAASPPARKRAALGNDKLKAHPNRKPLMDAYHEIHLAAMKMKPTWEAKQRDLANKLAKRGVTVEDLQTRAVQMFSLRGKFPAEHPDLPTLVAHWDKFVDQARDVTRGAVPAMRYEDYPEPGRQK